MSTKMKTVKKRCNSCGQFKDEPECAKHPGNAAASCRYCDLCEHGTPSSAHCAACHVHDDPSWRTAPVTDAEISQLRRWFSDYEAQYPSPHHAVRRHTPYWKRNYHDTEVSFLPMLLDEFIRLRNAAQSTSIYNPD